MLPKLPKHVPFFAMSIMAACGGPLEPQQSAEDNILASYTGQVGTCQWPSTVHIRMDLSGGYVGFCTGTVLRNRVIVTAAHCLADNPHRLRFYFGENANSNDQSQRVDIDGTEEIASRCTIHPDGHEVESQLSDDGYSGVDLAVCELPTQPGGVPEATPLTYGSCEHSYVQTQLSLKKTLHIVGTGREIPNPTHTTHYGKKRHVTVEPAGWVNYTGKPHLKLWQPDPCADSDIVSGGDSGGSVMMEMEDGSWRLIAVLVAKDVEYNSPKCGGDNARFLLATPVPNYLPWMEYNTLGLNNGFDLTRCHKWEQSEQAYIWENGGHCISQIYFTNPEVTGSKSWDDFACMDLDNNITPYFSGECNGWQPCGPFSSWETCTEVTADPGENGGRGGSIGDITNGPNPTHGSGGRNGSSGPNDFATHTTTKRLLDGAVLNTRTQTFSKTTSFSGR